MREGDILEILSCDKKLCLSCMEEHIVKRVEIEEENIFKGITVSYPARYEYCDRTEEYLTFGGTLNSNNLAMKDAYRKKVGLLTSQEIVSIRELYGISQKDLCKILNWGSSTIGRYESSQVQDSVHDDVLRLIADDPGLFLKLLKRAKDTLSSKTFLRSLAHGNELFRKRKDRYLRASLEASYAEYTGNSDLTGDTALDIDKVTDVVSYLSQKVSNLHKVKLMKMLWYCDFLSYKRTGKAITGLVYSAKAMGALPIGHDILILLDGIEYEEVEYSKYVGCRFKAPSGFKITKLSPAEVQIINEVIERFGSYNARQIVKCMHGEEAYLKTPISQPISYKHARSLSL